MAANRRPASGQNQIKRAVLSGLGRLQSVCQRAGLVSNNPQMHRVRPAGPHRMRQKGAV